MISILQWKDLWNWLPSESGAGAFAAGTTPAPMGDFLRRVVSPIDKAKRPLDSLNVVAKISFGGVLHVRTDEEKSGYKGPLFEAKPGDLVFSKIRVGQGSLCVIPNDLGHLAVSPEYPVYRADDRLIRPHFLNLLLRSAQFQKLLRSQASGNTTKKRIRPEDFEALEVPLPVLEEQDEILLRYDAELERAVGIEAEANAREREALQNFEAELGLTRFPTFPDGFFKLRASPTWTDGAMKGFFNVSC
jgi:type I restriction enzyme S subunit